MAEQVYKVRDPDGNLRKIRGPAGASDDEIIAQAQKLFAPAPAQARINEVPGPRRSYAATEVPLEAVKNVPESGKKFLAGMYETLTSPVQTIKGAWDIGAGALQKALPTAVVDFVNRFEANPEAGRRVVEAANAAGGMLKDRYGSWDNIKRTIAEDPVGAASDLSTILSGGATAAKTLGTAGRVGAAAATKVGVPAVAQAAQKLVTGAEATQEALGTAARVTNPLTVPTMAAQKAVDIKRAVLPNKLLQQEEVNAVRDATLRCSMEKTWCRTTSDWGMCWLMKAAELISARS